MREVGGDGPRTRCESRSEHGRASLFWTSLKELKVGRQYQKIQAQIDIETCTSTRSTTRRIGKVCVSDPRLVVKRDSPPPRGDQLPPTNLDYAIRQMPAKRHVTIDSAVCRD